ncbi:MAG: RING finger protein [Kistimonas sp.]|nr:RING finger protein [Kistimonas sp.]
MAFSMQPGPSSMVPGTSTGQPAAVVAATEEKGEIRIHGHNWLLRQSDIRRLHVCSICFDTAAERTLCKDTSHAVCSACCTKMEQREIDKCPSCRGPFASSGQRSFHDSILEKQQTRVLQDAAPIDCAECERWSGVEDGMKKHAQLCSSAAGHGKGKQRMKRKAKLVSAELYSCAWSEAGCTWRGSQEQKPAHSRACHWQPVTCSLEGCVEQMPLCQREEHEAGCQYRPASLGVLHTNWRRLQQMESLNQLCQQPVDSLAALSPAQRLERLQQTMSLFSLLYQAVSDAARAEATDSEEEAMAADSQEEAVSTDSEEEVRSADSEAGMMSMDDEITCGWGCGFHDARRRMSLHADDCPRLPQTCSRCWRQVRRADMDAHRSSCQARPVFSSASRPAAPDAQQQASGSQAGSPANRSLFCDYCQTFQPGQRYRFDSLVLEEHKQECPQRPVSCIWCLDSHPFTRFDEYEARCRIQSQTHVPYLGNRPLVHQSGALGPVFVRSPREDNPVFIRLPRQALVHQRASGTYRNLTENISFEWDGMSCAINFCYGVSQFRRPRLDVFSSTRKCRHIVSASLREDGGRLLEEYEEVGAPEGRVMFRAFAVGGPKGSKSSISNITIESLEDSDLAASQDKDFLLHLQVERAESW